MGNEQPRVAAFFDIDNTIMRGASIYHLARGLFSRGILSASGGAPSPTCDSAARLATNAARRRARGASPLRALVEGYLGNAHLAEAEEGCALAALLFAWNPFVTLRVVGDGHNDLWMMLPVLAATCSATIAALLKKQ